MIIILISSLIQQVLHLNIHLSVASFASMPIVAAALRLFMTYVVMPYLKSLTDVIFKAVADFVAEVVKSIVEYLLEVLHDLVSMVVEASTKTVMEALWKTLRGVGKEVVEEEAEK